ncbi:replication-relaxation family protein [Planomicrobium okeanokoites]|uniref:replication-relaxation family protein n=1 Tax=Planomicrobium okeanokoites TaxID=244 RepID=UPI000A06CF61|nr:replication-relaxation family protein [Planomicrobium okeanokoites]
MNNVYVVESTSRYKGIHVTERELELLKYIYEFNVFPAINFHRLYNAGSTKPRTSQAISIRLSKLVKSGVLIQLKSEVFQNAEPRLPTYAYRLGVRGFDLLIKEKFLSVEEGERAKSYGNKLNMPTTHNKMVSTVFALLVERLIQQGESLNSLQVGSFRGERHTGINKANGLTGYSPIIPDWVFETKDNIICLELDTGSQKMSTINMKFDRYKRITAHLNKPLIVIFSVGLSIKEELLTPKEKRASSLKDFFTEHTEWPSGFELYVLPTYRTPDLLNKLIRGKVKSSKLYSKGAANNWLNYAREASNDRLTYSMNKQEETNSLFFEDSYDLDLVAELIRGEKREQAGLLVMEEGSVRSYQKARTNMIRINNWNTQRALYESKTSLLLVYEKHISGVHDVLPIQPLCNLFIVNIEEVKAVAESKGNDFPPLVEMVTQYTRNERTLI